MASYRHLPPPPPPSSSSAQNPIHQRPNNNQYNQNWNYGFPQSYNHNNQYHRQHHYPPPPPETSYTAPPPPPPPPMHYPPNLYPQHRQQQPPLPPPPRSSPPPPAPHQNNEKELRDRKSKDIPHRQHKNAGVPPMSGKKSDRKRKAETEEDTRLRKKREYEKQRQLKKSQNIILQKTQKKQGHGHGSVIGSRMRERKVAPLLSAERAENKLKKPTTFVCKLKFRNELPDPTAQPKLMAFKKDKDQYTKYKITSLEKMYKPKLFVEPDLGIPLDLLDLSVYNPPSVRPPLAPEDEELLQDDEAVTLKNDSRKRKERPTDKGVAWLVKTQYISPLSMESTKQSLTEKQAKELREMKGGRDILENLNDSERQIKEIEASFEAAKSRPVHATNKDLRPIEVLPLLLDFDRYDNQFVVAAFDNAPTADSEMYAKLDKSVRDALESRAIMKSYVSSGSDATDPEKFLAYMVPAPRELSKDIYDENEEVSYSWVREYHWGVRGDDALDPTTYLVSFDESKARYLPLPTKLVLRKKRTKEGRSSDEVEQFAVPSSVVVRRRSSVSALELKKTRVYTKTKGSSSKQGGLEIDDDMEEQHRGAVHQDNYQSSGAEDDISD